MPVITTVGVDKPARMSDETFVSRIHDYNNDINILGLRMKIQSLRNEGTKVKVSFGKLVPIVERPQLLKDQEELLAEYIKKNYSDLLSQTD